MDQEIKLIDEIAQDSEVLRIFKFHSLRVMLLAEILSKEIGCYDEDLKIAALFHDIGKIGISKDILFKPEKLSDLEYMIIQSHCHVGNTILRKKLGNPRAAGFVRDHHERWDGKGYPRGLKGEDISIQGRIINICDSFDTMTIDRRNYQRSTLTYEESFEELKRCSWTQFDGSLVDTFISIVSKLKLPKTDVPWYSDQKSIEQFFRN